MGDSDNKAYNHKGWKKLNSAISNLDDNMRNNVKVRAALREMAKTMEEEFGLSKVEKIAYSEYDHPERKLYYNIHMAIAELDGVNFTQQLSDHDSWLQSRHILTEGLSGTQYDNPGNMSSDTLNFISK